MVKRVLEDPGLGLPGGGAHWLRAVVLSQVQLFQAGACVSEVFLTASLNRLAFSHLISEPDCMQ